MKLGLIIGGVVGLAILIGGIGLVFGKSWKTYKNSQAGFWFKHPTGWIVKDESGETKREVSVTEPKGEANVLIVAHIDDNLRKEGEVAKAVVARKEFLQSDKKLKILKFGSQTEGKITGYVMIGQREGWQVQERGLIGTTGRVIIMQSGAIATKYTDYKPILEKIMDSFAVE